jgi:hypothetical protein
MYRGVKELCSSLVGGIELLHIAMLPMAGSLSGPLNCTATVAVEGTHEEESHSDRLFFSKALRNSL